MGNDRRVTGGDLEGDVVSESFELDEAAGGMLGSRRLT
jgi:hypothetical protein